MGNSPLIFNDYIVTEAFIKTNLAYKKSEKKSIKIEQDFNAVITYDMKGSSFVELNLEINNNQNEFPFELSITIVGIFELNNSDYEEESYINLLKRNAIAILFPYLRSIVTDLTAKTNAFNPLILPPMNFVAMLEEENKVTVQKLKDVID